MRASLSEVPLRTPSNGNPAPRARTLVHDVAYLPHGRTLLSTGSRITTLIRTGSLYLQDRPSCAQSAFGV